MESEIPTSIGKSEIIYVEFPIQIEVLGQQFGNLISGISEIYYDSIWLDRAEKNKKGLFPDYDFGPEGLLYDDHFWVEAIYIGTPNKARFRGKKKHLGTALAIFIAIWGGAKEDGEFVKAGTEAWKTIVMTPKDLQLKDREIRLKDYEISEKELDLIAKADRLYNSGQISKFALNYKTENHPKTIEKLKQSVNLLDTTRKIIIEER